MLLILIVGCNDPCYTTSHRVGVFGCDVVNLTLVEVATELAVEQLTGPELDVWSLQNTNVVFVRKDGNESFGGLAIERMIWLPIGYDELLSSTSYMHELIHAAMHSTGLMDDHNHQHKIWDRLPDVVLQLHAVELILLEGKNEYTK